MPNDPETPPSIPRRRWPLRYVLLFVVGWFAFPVIAWVVWAWIETARLDRALDALEARKEPLDVAQFYPKPTTPPQKEASHLYAEAGKLVGDRTIAPQRAARVSQLIEELCTSDRGTPVRTSSTQQLQAFEEPYAKALELIDRASPLKGVGWADADRPQRLPILDVWPITLMRANVGRIARRACSGDADGAAAALLASLRLQQFLNLRISATRTAHSLQLVLSGAGTSPGVLQHIQDEYTATSSDRAFEDLMLRERALWLSLVLPGAFSDQPPRYGPRRITPVEAIATRLSGPLRSHRTVAELSEFAQALEVARQPWPSTFDAVTAFARAHPSRRSQSMPAGMLESLTRPLGAHFPATVLSSYVNGIAEMLARARASAAAVAVARYQRDHAGATPDSLRKLIPEYLPSLPIDPYSGAELTLRRDSAGYKIYSVGANRKDDRGEWEQHSDLQLSRRGDPPDVGIVVDSWPQKTR